MPNWCENTLEVFGNKKSIKQFKDMVKTEDTDLSLNKLRPMPEALEYRSARETQPGWYTWRLKHWGTKWDVEAKIVRESDENLQYAFFSAGSPPVAWMRQAAKTFPDLHFELNYREYSMAFEGRAISKKGRVIDRDWPFIFKEDE